MTLDESSKLSPEQLRVAVAEDALSKAEATLHPEDYPSTARTVTTALAEIRREGHPFNQTPHEPTQQP